MLKLILSVLAFSFSGYASQLQTFQIQSSINYRTFTINDEIFRAKMYCLGFAEGDRVVFVKGNPYGQCFVAKIVKPTTGSACEVLCE